jgi:hypothetical protein
VTDFHNPIVCASGPGIDENYQKLRQRIDWSDAALNEMGTEFTKLHRKQRMKILSRTEDSFIEFANKAVHPTVASAWAYAAGLLQNDQTALGAHYALPDSVRDSMHLGLRRGCSPVSLLHRSTTFPWQEASGQQGCMGGK